MSTMLPTESKSHSRRALLAGALGGLGAWAATAIGRASPVRAEGEAIVVGGEYATATSVTHIANQTNSDDVLSVRSFGGGVGVVGRSQTSTGVQGSSSSAFGVYATSISGTGARGFSSSGVGVAGRSSDNIGVFGDSGAYVGVYGDSENHNGVVGNNRSLNHAAVIGYSEVDGTGVEGISGGGVAIPGKAKTGVYGEAAQDTNSRGVWGHSPTGRGIQGSSTSGYAGYFAGKVFTNRFYELEEINTPASPLSNRARLFLRNRSGNTELCVKFPNGVVKVLGSE